MKEKYYGGNVNYYSHLWSFKKYLQRKEWYQKWYYIPVKDWYKFNLGNSK